MAARYVYMLFWGGRQDSRRTGWVAEIELIRDYTGAKVFSMRLGRGAGISLARCAGDGWLTLLRRPSSTMRRCASSQVGSSAVGWIQWTTEASSHQSSSLGMAWPCAPEVRKAFMAASSSQAVAVQNTFFTSRSTF